MGKVRVRVKVRVMMGGPEAVVIGRGTVASSAIPIIHHVSRSKP